MNIPLFSEISQSIQMVSQENGWYLNGYESPDDLYFQLSSSFDIKNYSQKDVRSELSKRHLVKVLHEEQDLLDYVSHVFYPDEEKVHWMLRPLSPLSEPRPVKPSSPSLNQSMSSFTLDAVTRDFLCPVCKKLFRDAVMVKKCCCRFCERCLRGVMDAGHTNCPNIRCFKPVDALQQNGTIAFVRDLRMDDCIKELGLQNPEPGHDHFLEDAEELSRTGPKMLNETTVLMDKSNLSRYDSPPDLTTQRDEFYQEIRDEEQPKNVDDLENPLMAAAIELQKGAERQNVLPTTSSYARYRRQLAKRFLDNVDRDVARETKRRKRELQRVRKMRGNGWNLDGYESPGDLCVYCPSSDGEGSEKGEHKNFGKVKIVKEIKKEEPLTDDYDSDVFFPDDQKLVIDSSSDGEQNEAESDTESVRSGVEDRKPQWIFPYRRGKSAHWSKVDPEIRALILEPDMNAVCEGVDKTKLIPYYLIVKDRSIVEFLKLYVMKEYALRNKTSFVNRKISVKFMPLTSDQPSSDVMVLKRDGTDSVQGNKKTDGGKHAVSLQVENPSYANVFTIDYPSRPLLEHVTLTQIRESLWLDRKVPLRLVYQFFVPTIKAPATPVLLPSVSLPLPISPPKPPRPQYHIQKTEVDSSPSLPMTPVKIDIPIKEELKNEESYSDDDDDGPPTLSPME